MEWNDYIFVVIFNARKKFLQDIFRSSFCGYKITGQSCQLHGKVLSPRLDDNQIYKAYNAIEMSLVNR